MISNQDYVPSKEDFVPADKARFEKSVAVQEKQDKAWRKTARAFLKSPSTLLGFVLLFIILLLAFLPPVFSQFSVSQYDSVYACKLPKIESFTGSGFWDGSYEKTVNEKMYYYLVGIGAGAEDKDGKSFSQKKGLQSAYSPIGKTSDVYQKEGTNYRDIRVDSYLEVGFIYDLITQEKYVEILEYEEKSGVKVLYPMVNTNSPLCEDAEDANLFYCTDGFYPCNQVGDFIDLETGETVASPKGKTLALYPNYLTDANGAVVYCLKLQGGYKVRVLCRNYYQYKTWVNNGKGTDYTFSPSHVFGSDAQGYDILVRVSSGVRVSLFLALAVFIVNYIIGTLYGCVEGYYGGTADLVMSRITEFISGVPFIIVATLFYQYFIKTGTLSVFLGLGLALCFSGWISIASQTRRQIYRFKSREYVYAARMLGASDLRIVAKHIYPNAIGTLITSLVLFIPNVIFQETSLSFLGIIDFNGTRFTSLGTLIANGQNYLGTYPHIILLPVLTISAMMIGFNLIGNGLRGAFGKGGRP